MALENYVKFLRGTPTAYKNLTEKDKDTLYFISEKNSDYGVLYLGNKLIAGGGGEPNTVTLDALKDVVISEIGLEHNSLLVYDEQEKGWVNKPLNDVLETIVGVMEGANAVKGGKSGLVPAPEAGQENHFLRGDGSWAKVAAETNVFEVTPEEGESHLTAIERVVGDVEVNSGDIAIVKELIANEKYQHTAYVFDEAWKAMDGNYNAENVYFDEDLLTTSAVGNIKLTNGQATIKAAGKNLKEVFNAIFVKEQNPTTTQPSASITLTEAGSYEVGETVSVNYSASFNAGRYSYGPATGVVANSYGITDGVNTKTSQTGSFADLLVTDNTNYQLTVTVAHSEGAIPVTNVGNDYAAGKIAAGSKTGTSGAITGYRPFFYGLDKTENVVYDSALIRGLTNGGAYDASKELVFTASELDGVKRFIIAIPSNSIAGDRTGIISANITSSMNADAIEFYEELGTTVAVQGANGHTTTAAYRVWIYEPTSIAAEEIHKVVLG